MVYVDMLQYGVNGLQHFLSWVTLEGPGLRRVTGTVSTVEQASVEQRGISLWFKWRDANPRVYIPSAIQASNKFSRSGRS